MGMDDCISNSGHIGYCFVESQNNGSVDETDTNHLADVRTLSGGGVFL